MFVKIKTLMCIIKLQTAAEQLLYFLQFPYFYYTLFFNNTPYFILSSYSSHLFYCFYSSHPFFASRCKSWFILAIFFGIFPYFERDTSRTTSRYLKMVYNAFFWGFVIPAGFTLNYSKINLAKQLLISKKCAKQKYPFSNFLKRKCII